MIIARQTLIRHADRASHRSASDHIPTFQKEAKRPEFFSVQKGKRVLRTELRRRLQHAAKVQRKGYVTIHGRKGGRHTQANISRTHQRKKYPRSLEKELKGYRDAGISLHLNGRPSTPQAIARACQIAEDGGYMRDYSVGEQGAIADVNFRYIKEKN